MAADFPAAAEPAQESAKVRILVADRNRHIRDLLRRELAAEGYQTFCAKDAWEVLGWLAEHGPPHLLILDLDLPMAAEINLLEQLTHFWPGLPILLYSFPPAPHPPETARVVFLEKTGDPSPLKAAIVRLLKS